VYAKVSPAMTPFDASQAKSKAFLRQFSTLQVSKINPQSAKKSMTIFVVRLCKNAETNTPI